MKRTKEDIIEELESLNNSINLLQLENGQQAELENAYKLIEKAIESLEE